LRRGLHSGYFILVPCYGPGIFSILSGVLVASPRQAVDLLTVLEGGYLEAGGGSWVVGVNNYDLGKRDGRKGHGLEIQYIGIYFTAFKGQRPGKRRSSLEMDEVVHNTDYRASLLYILCTLPRVVSSA
jgi:hypothetical protein